MKQILIVIVALLLASCSQQFSEEIQKPEEDTDNAKKVDLLITVKTAVDESAINEYLDENKGVMLSVGSAEFLVELEFPENGGNAVKKTGTYHLTNYTVPAYGNARDCKVILLEEAYQERKIRRITALLESNEISFAITELPVGEMILPTFYCLGTPGSVPDYGILTQLTLPLQERLWTLKITGSSISEHEEGITILSPYISAQQPLYFADVTIEGIVY